MPTGLGTDGMVTYADAGAWDERVHVEPVWGTHVVVHLRGDDLCGADDAVADVVAFLHEVDAWFSTYRADSPVSLHRNGLLERALLPLVVRQVLDACEHARRLTDGVFDPWAVLGGVDPSGYVKGWAADVAADRLVAMGFTDVSVDASGDLACRGLMAPGRPWAVGITNPYDTQSVIRVVEVPDGFAMATSGLYERGGHIANTVVGDCSVHYDSATIVGPDAGLADALATACLVEGPTCVRWFAGMPEWSAYLVKDGRAEHFGPAFS